MEVGSGAKAGATHMGDWLTLLISYYLVGIPAGKVTTVHPIMLLLKNFLAPSLLGVYYPIPLLVDPLLLDAEVGAVD